jgi:hypothetical protein
MAQKASTAGDTLDAKHNCANLAEAREASGRFIETARQVSELFGQSGEVMASAAREFCEKAAQQADERMRLSFELAQRLVEVREIDEALAVQTEFAGETIQTCVRQAMELSNLITLYVQSVSKENSA